MGFLDKAKQLAGQAQSKLDEVQKHVKSSDSSKPRPDGPIAEHDTHARPVGPKQTTTTQPHGDPLTDAPVAPPASTGPTPDPSGPAPGGAPLAGPSKTQGDPLAGPPSSAPRGPLDGAPSAPHGDPLAGSPASAP